MEFKIIFLQSFLTWSLVHRYLEVGFRLSCHLLFYVDTSESLASNWTQFISFQAYLFSHTTRTPLESGALYSVPSQAFKEASPNHTINLI